ncbi:MAG TPA: formylglycine-generating enzyme family protein, partial [Bacteroidales bacterium]|nr:formylglycine-generating enzyme family protein [Bacteroidales bacterium]
WEYACRAGTATPFATGTCLATSQANFDGEQPYHDCRKGSKKDRTTAVGSYAPNAWGLYDMHGNVWEWVSDWYDGYPADEQTDPVGPDSSEYRLARGGGFINDAGQCRSARRKSIIPDMRADALGIRLVKEVD